MIRLPLLPQLEDHDVKVTLLDGRTLTGTAFASRPDGLALDDDAGSLRVIPWPAVLLVEIPNDIPPRRSATPARTNGVRPRRGRR